MRAYRAAWAGCDYKATSVMAHAADRQKVIAMADLIRYERLLRDVEAAKPEEVDLAVSRNKQGMPSYERVEQCQENLNTVRDLGTHANVVSQAMALLGQVKTYTQHFNKWRVASAADEFDDIAYAKTVVYSHLVDASLRLAEGLLTTVLEDE